MRLKLQEVLAQFLDGVEGSYPEQVFLEDAHKVLGAAVSFRGLDKSGRALDAQEGDFRLEIMRHILPKKLVRNICFSCAGLRVIGALVVSTTRLIFIGRVIYMPVRPVVTRPR